MEAYKIYKELIKRGASPEQANMYLRLVGDFVSLSKQDCVTEKHHILPANCQWWKKHEHAEWNIATISWQLHGSLHAVLCHIFPTNEHLFKAAQITSRMFRGNEKKLRLKPEIIRLYLSGKSCSCIGKKLGLSYCAIRSWLLGWGIEMRTLREAQMIRWTGKNTAVFKDEIIQMYLSKKSPMQIGKSFDLHVATIRRWLKVWGIKRRGNRGPQSLIRRTKRN